MFEKIPVPTNDKDPNYPIALGAPELPAELRTYQHQVALDKGFNTRAWIKINSAAHLAALGEIRQFSTGAVEINACPRPYNGPGDTGVEAEAAWPSLNEVTWIVTKYSDRGDIVHLKQWYVDRSPKKDGDVYLLHIRCGGGDATSPDVIMQLLFSRDVQALGRFKFPAA